MRLSRTDAGLSNMALFLDVDFIVYTEGGRESLSIESVENGEFNKSATDIGYWSGVFFKYGFNKKVQFRAVGSRASLDFIAEKVCDGVLSNVIVVKDRDLDPYLGKGYSSPLVIQSYGYSWENDVWGLEITLRILSDYNKSGGVDPSLVEEVRRAFAGFWRHAARLVFLEVGLRGLSHTVIPKSGEQLIEASSKGLPAVKVVRVREILRSKRKEIARGVVFSIRRSQLEVSRDCYGKLIQAFCYRVLEVAGKRSGAFSAISIDIANSIALSTYKTADLYERCPNRHAYYSEVFRRLKDVA